MAIGNEYGSGVPMAPAVILRRLHEAFDLALGEVFAGAAFGHCYIYCCWRLLEPLQIFHGFCRFSMLFCPSDKLNYYNGAVVNRSTG